MEDGGLGRVEGGRAGPLIGSEEHDRGYGMAREFTSAADRFRPCRLFASKRQVPAQAVTGGLRGAAQGGPQPRSESA
jgi:hypothetical protein